jgi:hypothetical protein
MMRVFPILLGAVLLGACTAAQAPADPPAPVILPEEITNDDLVRHDLFGFGCYFLDGIGEKAQMLFVASDEKGWMKLDSAMVELAADRKSTELPYLSWSRYAGSAYTVVLDRDQAKARSTGPETESAPGEITIRDENDRVVFTRKGLIDCGA